MISDLKRHLTFALQGSRSCDARPGNPSLAWSWMKLCTCVSAGIAVQGERVGRKYPKGIRGVASILEIIGDYRCGDAEAILSTSEKTE